MILEFEKFRTDLEDLRRRLKDVGEGLHIDHLQEELEELREEQNADGFYVIDNAAKLNWFAGQVASGATAINAVLAADIDLCTSEYPDLMIGNSSNMFGGIFDGQGHTVTYSYSISSNYCGLFSYAKNATIRNLIVKGDAVVTAIHFGALIGRGEGTILVENVITDVDITGQRSSVTGDGGMIGALYANITFNNCATLGKLGYSGSSMYSGFSGYSSGTSSATLNNCYTISELTEGTGTGSCFTFIHGSGAKVFNNCYYVNAIGTVQGTAVEADEVANGSLAAKLGAGWYQNIGEDAYPVLDKTHAVVKEISEAGYATMYIPDAVEIPEDVEVYTGSFEETWLKLDAVEGTVPAWEPVVLKGAHHIQRWRSDLQLRRRRQHQHSEVLHRWLCCPHLWQQQHDHLRSCSYQQD